MRPCRHDVADEETIAMTEEGLTRRLADKIRDAIEHARKIGREEVAKGLGLLYETVMTEDQEHHRLSRRRDDPPPTADSDES
jgi:hypothetical protein